MVEPLIYSDVHFVPRIKRWLDDIVPTEVSGLELELELKLPKMPEPPDEPPLPKRQRLSRDHQSNYSGSFEWNTSQLKSLSPSTTFSFPAPGVRASQGSSQRGRSSILGLKKRGGSRTPSPTKKGEPLDLHLADPPIQLIPRTQLKFCPPEVTACLEMLKKAFDSPFIPKTVHVSISSRSLKILSYLTGP